MYDILSQQHLVCWALKDGLARLSAMCLWWKTLQSADPVIDWKQKSTDFYDNLYSSLPKPYKNRWR